MGEEHSRSSMKETATFPDLVAVRHELLQRPHLLVNPVPSPLQKVGACR
jgi:hypothetical protein